MTKETTDERNNIRTEEVNPQNMQIASKKTKSKKSHKVKKAKNKKSKPNESTTKKVSGEMTDAGKLSDQENSSPDPNAATDSIDPKESNKESDTVERSNAEESKQERPSIEEILTEAIYANKVPKDAHTEQVPEDTVDPEDTTDAEQNKDEKSLILETDISSEQNDTAMDPNVTDGVAEVTAAAPEKGEEIAVSKIFKAIQEITKSQGDIPGQPATEGKSTPGINSSLLEICANDIMQNQVTWASPEDSLQQAFAKMQQTDAGYIMIGLNGALEGIVSKSDITRAMSPYLLPIFAKWRRPLDDATLKIRIKWIMSRPVRTIKPQTSLTSIMEHMSQFRGRCLPVMDEEGNVQGLVTAFDIFEALLKSNSNTCSTEEAPRELVKTASSTETT